MKLHFASMVKTCIHMAVAAMLMIPVALTAQEASDEKHEIKAEVVDGKVIITLPNGETKTIEIGDQEGTTGVIVETLSENNNGEKSTHNRAILVGPDGEQRVIFDNDGEAGTIGRIMSGPQVFQWRNADGGAVGGTLQLAFDSDEVNDFVIGIDTNDLTEALKSHAGVAHGVVVQRVFEDSAAETAGMQEFDIIVRANGSELNSIDDLIKVIQDTGENESEMRLLVVREGDEVDVKVKPEKRSGGVIMARPDIEFGDFTFEGMHSDGEFKFERVLPGLIQRRTAKEKDLAAEIAELREMIEQLREEIRNK